MTSLPDAFYARPTLDVARVHDHPTDGRLVGRIVETEAYLQDDAAFRSWGVYDGAVGLVRPEGRALPLFGPPGRAYVYLVYGRYWLLNVVTEPEGRAGCVLIRTAAPRAGLDAMFDRRPAARAEVDLANGPGKLTQAFALDRAHHGMALTTPPLYLAPGNAPAAGQVGTSRRIGLRFGTEAPYRFFVKGHPCVSPGR